MGKPKKSPEALLLQALNHPIRISALMELREKKTLSANQHAKVIDQPLNLVSYHFTQLRDAGLIYLFDQIPRRGAVENIYALVPGTPVFVLIEFTSHLLATTGDNPSNEQTPLRLVPIEVDVQGEKELKKFLEEATECSKRLALEAGERLRKEGKKGQRYDVGLGAFRREEPPAPPEDEDGEERQAA